MAAAVELHDRLGPDSSKNIKRVVIHTFSAARLYPGCDNAGPFQSVQQTKMSLQFGVAASLAFGKLDEADYRQFEHPEVGRLLQCCEIQLDLAFEGVAPRRQPARVEVLLHDGKTVECELDDVPWLDGPAVQARLHHSAQNHLDSSAIARLTEVLDALWQMPDSAELFELLAW